MISLIAAVAENNCIGIKNDLPWDIPEDLKHFKEVTQGNPVLMGYNTFLSILSRINKPLPNRTNVVISRQPTNLKYDNVIMYTDLQAAIDNFKSQNLFVIGGASIYKQTIDLADKLYITKVHESVDGDAFFPEINPQIWNLIKDDNHGKFSFQEYLKK